MLVKGYLKKKAIVFRKNKKNSPLAGVHCTI